MQGTELAATSSSSGGFNPSTLLILIVIVVAFYMLLIRPQQRRRQQAQQQQNTIQPGARVRTTAGLYATVVEVDGDDVVLEVAPGVHSRYMKRAIMDVVTPADAVDEPAEDEASVEDEYDGDTDETDETDETDAQEDDVEDTRDAAEAGDDEDDDERTAYERATGTKQD